MLAGFAQAFWLLSNVNEDLMFGTVSKSLQTSFLYMLGQDVSADFDGTVAPAFATFLLVIFLMVMMILMLNLLIALMGDTFAVVRKKGLALWRREQANIMFDQVYELAGERKVKPHLHILKYTSDIGIESKENKLQMVVDASKQHVMKYTELLDPQMEQFYSNSNNTNDNSALSSQPNTSNDNEELLICDSCRQSFLANRNVDNRAESTAAQEMSKFVRTPYSTHRHGSHFFTYGSFSANNTSFALPKVK